jgi:hypothetical protein
LSELIKYRLNNENESKISNKKIIIFIIIIEKNITSTGLLKSNDKEKELKIEGSKGEFATTVSSISPPALPFSLNGLGGQGGL